MNKSTIPADMTRVLVAGEAIPPYEGATMYLRDTLGVYWVAYDDGYMDRLGMASEAFGGDEITLHPDEES